MSFPPPSAPPRKSSKLPFVLGGIGVVVLLCLGVSIGAAMSGDDDAPTAAPTTAATAAATVATSPTAAPTSAGEPTAKPTPSRTRSRAAAARVTVPDGVGQNYQTAQDLWRGAGLIVLPAEDASGEDRLMVLDANWVVLAQDPGAGSKVPAGSTIRATVKKYSD